MGGERHCCSLWQVARVTNLRSVSWMVVAQARHRKKPVKKAAKRAPARERGSGENSRIWQRHERDVWIVLLFMVGLLIALAEARALGPVGHVIARALALMFGVGRFALPVILAVSYTHLTLPTK